MHPRFFLLCFILSALLMTGCAKPWTNADSGNKQQSAAQFERESVACEVMAGEKYPLDKHSQLKLYNQCMSDKGWVREEVGDGFPINKKK